MFNVSIEVNIICCLLHNLGIIVVKHYQQHYYDHSFHFSSVGCSVFKIVLSEKVSKFCSSCFNELLASSQGFSTSTPYFVWRVTVMSLKCVDSKSINAIQSKLLLYYSSSFPFLFFFPLIVYIYSWCGRTILLYISVTKALIFWWIW